ncbi:GNAT family N-acetyltransferase [Flavobacterium sp.]|uniref:GNAT family N-acetyltransferase n=1 Tax=Flavobacterium sp. TaxID=239 RepID=UPI0039E4E8AD
MEIKTITEIDYAAVSRIYQEGITTGMATFETQVPNWTDWDKSHLQNCRFAAYENGEMLGWCALTAVSNRCIYAGVAEVSIYVAQKARGKGIGFALLNHTIQESEKQNYWTLQSGIFEENTSSIKLHEKCGFRTVGLRERIGKINGLWKNNVVMERRSKIVGNE